MIIKRYNKFMESLNKRNMWEIIPESIKDIYNLFSESSKSLFVVGGAVRDFLNNDKPKDFDLATDATPDEVINILKGYRTNLQGKAFGVVVVYTKDEPMGFEIATFREDIYGDDLGKTRNPGVKFSTIENDVARRDIPWNALFYDLDKREIVDLVNGIEDLENKITRFVGDPDMRIKEDPLRILRLCRFSSRYEFTIEENTKNSINKNKDQLKIIVPNRIWDEFYKAYLQVKDFSIYLNYINEFNLCEYIFPGISINSNIIHCNSIELYLANLFKNEKVFNFGSYQEKLVQGFLIPIDIARVITFLVWFQDFIPENVGEFYSKKNSFMINNNTIKEWIVIAGLIDTKYQAFVDYTPTTSAQDLMSKGFSGKRLGDEIRRLEIDKFKELI